VAEEVFATGRKPEAAEVEAQKTELYEQLGRLQMELAWVKKKSAGLG
jgi:hypothetical protein